MGYGTDLMDYFKNWNSQVLVAVQVETPEALANVEAIAATPGIDVLFIGPNDLSAGLGFFRQFDRPEYKQAVDRILRAARTHGVAAGIMCGSDADEVLERFAQGFTFVSAGSDTRLLGGAAAAMYGKIRKGMTEETAAKR
jgi:2-keto-3-deoxy-L-rhamnonate aldolase RhmA